MRTWTWWSSVRGRRAHRCAGPRGRRAAGAGDHQGRAGRRQHVLGPGRHRRGPRRNTIPATTSARTSRTPWSAGAGLADPVAVAHDSRPPARPRFARLRARGARFDAGAGRAAAHRRGRPLADRVVHAGGDATGAEIERALLAAPGLPAVLSGSPAAGRGAGRGPAVLAGCRCSTAVGRAGLIRVAQWCWPPAAAGSCTRATTNPDGGDRRRPGGRRCGPGRAGRPGVRAVPPDGAVDRAPARAGIGHWSPRRCAARARCCRRRRRRIMPGVHPLADLAPRDVVGAGDHPPGERAVGVADHVFLDATGIAGRPCSRSGSRPWLRRAGLPGSIRDRADPGGTGRALPVRRRRHRPGRPNRGSGSVRGRRGGQDRPARRQPAGFELAARRSGHG